MARMCANCGTEVDEDALFCPTCGEPLTPGVEPELPAAPDWPAVQGREATGDEASVSVAGEGPEEAAHEEVAEPLAAEPPGGRPGAAEPYGTAPPAEEPWAPMPLPSGTWERGPSPEPPEEVAAAVPSQPPAWPAAAEEAPAVAEEPQPAIEEPPSRPEPAPGPAPIPPPQPAYHTGAGERSTDTSVPPWRRGATARPAAAVEAAPYPEEPRPRPGPIRPEPILHPPETIAGWLESGGALVGIVAMLLPWRAGIGYTSAWGFASGINVLFAVLLLAVLAVVLLPHLLPAIPRRDLALAAVGLIGTGIGLDRLGISFMAAGAVIFLIAMLALAVGGLLEALDLDRRAGGSQP